MKPSRNAFLGYTYQETIAFLLLVMMDAERQINKIEIEADINNNFDDIKITTNDVELFCQIKDLDNTTLSEIKIENGFVSIKNKKHKLSSNSNIIFFKDLSVNCNDQILGIPAYKYSNIYIISLSRIEAENIISEKYQYNDKREPLIDRFFKRCLDTRHLRINRNELPAIDIYNTKLLEDTINVGKSHLEFDNLLFIEGKPGVGKSHFVNCLADEYKNNIIYRFWVSSQDKDYKARLIFKNFITNISKELFNDFKYRTEDDIIQKLHDENKTIIIDGFDHVENYYPNDLNSFIGFINRLKEKCKTIILSRPLKVEIKWKKQTLSNWNDEETKKVLNELYHISDYEACQNIFSITDGYPILVRFIAEHYKLYNKLPQLNVLRSIDDYYGQIIERVNIKSALSLFLTSRSYFMESEIPVFLENELADCVSEIISSYPYLFEKRLNRISLFHDSLNTYLRFKNIDFSKRNLKVKEVVYQSIMIGEKKYLSRFTYFDLDKEMKLSIIKKYTSIHYFKNIIKDTIDFEAIRSFYFQIRALLAEFEPQELNIINYYDLSLIINMIERDHVSTLNTFFYTYVKCLLYNGYNVENITSSGYLFAMLYFITTNDITLLYNETSNNHFDTSNFYENLRFDIQLEEEYFENYHKPLKRTPKINSLINKELKHESVEFFYQVLTYLYINKTEINELLELEECIKTYVDVDKRKGTAMLEGLLPIYNTRAFFASMILNEVENRIVALGEGPFPNEYRILSLDDIIAKNRHIGSFKMWVMILNYMRLSMHDKRKIDLSNIGKFWTLYHERKDYSVINIDVALKVFEEKKLITIEQSCDTIIMTQSMSEKGIRHIFNNYIMLHDPDIISFIVDRYNFENLKIEWFNLPEKYIDAFPDRIYEFALRKILEYNRHSMEIDFVEVENVYKSRRWNQLLEDLIFLRLSIRIPEKHPHLIEIKNLPIEIRIESPKEDESKYKMNSIDRYNQGILDSRDIALIKEKKIDISEVAGYTNGYYSVFSDLEIYKIFDEELVKNIVPNILHTAILGKIKGINMFGNLFYFPGNVPRFINDYNATISNTKLYNSFKCFLELSMLDIINGN